MIRYLLLSIKLALFLLVSREASLVYAQESRRLEEIESAVTLQEAKLVEISIRQTKIDDSLKKIAKEIDAAKKEAADLGEKQSSAKREQEEISRAQAGIDEEIRERSALLEKRLRALAFESSHDWVVSTGMQDSRLDVEWIARMLSRVQGQDRQLLASLADLTRQQAERAAALEENIRQREELRKKIETTLRVLEVKLGEQRRLKEELSASKRSIESVVQALRAEAMRLEVVVASVTMGEREERDDGEERPEGKDEEKEASATSFVSPQERKADDKTVSLPRKPEEFHGVGLKSSKGTLMLPVKGMVKSLPKAPKNSSNFSDLVFSKGIELLAEAPEVHSVSQGRVIFVGSMPGYGRVAILDHGSRSYSLYAKLEEVKVRVGDVVEEGETIALVGSPDNRGSNFYLEIRENGMAVNPKGYFRNL